ncbi:MAG: hypothetical protein LBF44_01265 [Holosporaceae bacterium]|jgi:hypothetical protein|nr:hypothetical protein [Holosporaceae bacterium]
MFFRTILFLFGTFFFALQAMEIPPLERSSDTYNINRDRFRSLLSEEERNFIRERAVEDNYYMFFPGGITITEAEPFLYRRNTNEKILVYASDEIIRDLRSIDPSIETEYCTNYEEEEYRDREEEELNYYTTTTDREEEECSYYTTTTDEEMRRDYYQFSATTLQLRELLLLKTEYLITLMGYGCDYIKICSESELAEIPSP